MPIAPHTRRLALLIVLALTLPLAARADDASHRAKAQELMTVLHTERMVQQAFDNIMKQVNEAADRVAGPSPAPDAKAKADDFKKQAAQLITSQLGWEVMQAGFTDIYVKNFTEDQLDAILAFYKTPAGTALLENMPSVNSQVTQIGNSHMSALQPQLKELFQSFQKSESPAPPPSLGPAGPSAPATPSAPSPAQPPK